MEATLVAAWIALASLLYFVAKATGWPFFSKSRRLPPGPTPLPLIGNVFDMRGGELPHVLAGLAKTYGPVMALRFGLTTTIVVSSRSTARDVLRKNDHALAARPPTDSSHGAGHSKGSILWLPSGDPIWRQHRAATATHLVSIRRLEETLALRERKAHEIVAAYRRHVGKPIEIIHAAFGGILNLISNLLFSADVEDLSSLSVLEFKHLAEGIISGFGKPNISDFFPFLGMLDLQGRRRYTARHIQKVYDFFDKIIDQRLLSAKAGTEKYDDFLDQLLKLISMGKLDRPSIKALLLDLFSGGTHTSSATVQWAMAELLRNPGAMAKARAELRSVLGSKESVEESDTAKLPYLLAVMKETMRLHPIGPILMPHSATEDGVELSGYMVPRGASVLVNIWAIMRDPEVWPDPDEFMPERFLERPELEFQGKEFSFLPFGSGRRVCPGMPLALRMVPLVLASMLHAFEWRLPDGMEARDLDVRESFEMVLDMAVPLRAVPTLVTKEHGLET